MEKKSSMILKKLESYLSFNAKANDKRQSPPHTPTGCFSVYVGPDKERFVIKAKHANHPLFKRLLEDAEMEYGFQSKGPLCLPCELQLFYDVLAEITNNNKASGNKGQYFDDDHILDNRSLSCRPFNYPLRRLSKSTHDMTRGRGSYGFLTP